MHTPHVTPKHHPSSQSRNTLRWTIIVLAVIALVFACTVLGTGLIALR